ACLRAVRSCGGFPGAPRRAPAGAARRAGTNVFHLRRGKRSSTFWTGSERFAVLMRGELMSSAFTRRAFVAAVAAVAAGRPAFAPPPGRVRRFAPVALPMQNTDAMLSFYRRLGFPMRETANAVSVY